MSSQQSVALSSSESDSDTEVISNEVVIEEEKLNQVIVNHQENEDMIFSNYDLSIVKSEDLKFFQLSKIALNRGFSRVTLTDVLDFFSSSSSNTN